LDLSNVWLMQISRIAVQLPNVWHGLTVPNPENAALLLNAEPVHEPLTLDQAPGTY